MSTPILIAENIIESGHFLEATEQEGEYWGQPQPDPGNGGALRLLSKGSPADFSYSGTTTANGAVDGTTLIDNALVIFGAGYFIGGKATVGAETRDVTDFNGMTGELTVSPAFSSQVMASTAYTLVVEFKTRDIRAEIVDPGDVGDANFKFSHNGTTYLGRRSVRASDWPKKEILSSGVDDDGNRSTAEPVQARDGTWIFIYVRESDDVLCCIRSSKQGLTWGSEIEIGSSGNYVQDGVGPHVLKSGRILIHANTIIYYSDDHGVTWSYFSTGYGSGQTNVGNRMIKLFDGRFFVCYSRLDAKWVVYGRIGTTLTSWSSEITIADEHIGNRRASCVQAPNADIVCSYVTEESGEPNKHHCRAKISSTGGATWGSIIMVGSNDVTGNYIYGPTSLIKDIDGTLYCFYNCNLYIYIQWSLDNGASWNWETATTVVTSGGGVDQPEGFGATLMDGYKIVTCFVGFMGNSLNFAVAGYHTTYVPVLNNEIPCAIEGIAQSLICNAQLIWHGGGGESGDKWPLKAEYEYSMANLIEDSPSRSWRSKQDNIACAIVLDAGSAARFYADGVAFFGGNIRSRNFQMNNTNSWGSPSVDQAISSDIATGALDANSSANEIKDASLLAGYKDHELKGTFLRFTSGALDTYTFKIIDNVDDYIFCDGDTSTAVATDTFVLYQGHVAKTFTGGAYRYIRISIAAQRTPASDGYYGLGTMKPGRAIALSRTWATGWEKNYRYGIELLRTPIGGPIRIKQRERKREFIFEWPVSRDSRKEILALLDYLDGKNIALVPDGSDMTDCYLVKHVGDAEQIQQAIDMFDVCPLVFEEAL